MLKTNGLMQFLLGALYVSLQALFWLNIVYFVFLRLEAPLLTGSAIFWLIISGWIILLPLPYLSTVQRSFWFIATGVAVTVTGYLLYDNIATIIILAAGVIWFSLKKVSDGIGAKEFITSLMTIMIVFGITFLVSYFIQIYDTEISRLVWFFIIAFLITIIGSVISQFSNYDGQKMNKGFMKQWGIYNGWVWGMIVLLSLAAVVILLVLSVIYPLILWIFKAILTPIVTFVTEVILPWLQREMLKLMAEAPQEENGDINWSQDEMILNDQLKALSPTATLIWNIIMYSILIAVIAFIAYKFYQYVRRQIEKRETSTETQKGDSIIIQAADASDENPTTWRDKLRNIFRPYSGQEEHLIRKEYRQMLKVLKKKGLWNSSSMTVQQLNQFIHASEHSSALYERLRYGDQQLTDDEVVFYREEIQKIMNEIKK